MIINSKTYYMIKDNERFTSSILFLDKAEEGWSRPDIVEIQYNNRVLTGYLKKSTDQGDENVIETILNRIGKELNVPMAETVGVFSDDSYSQLIAIISISVDIKPNEKFVSFRKMRDQLFEDYVAGSIPSSDWLKRWSVIRERKKHLPADMWEVDAICLQDYFDCIMFAFEILKLYGEKNEIKIGDFERDFVKMMLFDVLIGQADRSPSNYGIIIDTDINSAHLAPIFDNSTLKKPHIQNNVISFNHLLLDRCQAAKVEFEVFKDLTDEFRDVLNKKLVIILELANSTRAYYDIKIKEFLVERIKEGVRIIEAL